MADIQNIVSSLRARLIVDKGVINKNHITTSENLLKICYQLPWAERSNVFDEIRGLAKYLGSINVRDNRLDWLPYYQLYNVLCSIAYKITEPISDEHTNDNLLGVSDIYKSQGFWLADRKNSEELATHLKLLFDLLPDKGKSFADGELKRSVVQGYSVNRSEVNANQLHVEELPIEAKRHLENYITKSNLIENLSRGLGFNLKVCNIRSYRYFHSKLGQEIRPHRDGIPPNVFKFMAFNGDIKIENGAFEVLKDEPILRKDLRLLNSIERRITKILNPNAAATSPPLFSVKSTPLEVIESCVGINPFMIVNSKEKLHRALNPEIGLIRDTVEISFMPRLLDDALVTVGGCQSGAPRNPFSFV
jgi:hypothetical protein